MPDTVAPFYLYRLKIGTNHKGQKFVAFLTMLKGFHIKSDHFWHASGDKL